MDGWMDGCLEAGNSDTNYSSSMCSFFSLFLTQLFIHTCTYTIKFSHVFDT